MRELSVRSWYKHVFTLCTIPPKALFLFLVLYHSRRAFGESVFLSLAKSLVDDGANGGLQRQPEAETKASVL
jgi:hypothetical protein